MKLNTIGPAPGSKKTRTRVGRGASAGQGKTCGRGVKGQRARKGGYHKVGFEGGQMPLQRRLHKVGGGTIDLASLKAASLVPADSLHAKIVLSGEVKGAYTVTGVGVTKGAR